MKGRAVGQRGGEAVWTDDLAYSPEKQVSLAHYSIRGLRKSISRAALPTELGRLGGTWSADFHAWAADFAYGRSGTSTGGLGAVLPT